MFCVEREVFKPHGKKFVFENIVSSNTALVVPVLDDGRLILERQYRYTVDKYLYEFPAGHIEKGESPAKAIARELEEESGYRPKKVNLMFKAYPVPGSKTELGHYFVGTGLVKTKIHLERDELITISKVTVKRALEMVRTNEIRDLKSIASLLFYVNYKAPK